MHKWLVIFTVYLNGFLVMKQLLINYAIRASYEEILSIPIKISETFIRTWVSSVYGIQYTVKMINKYH